MRLASAAAAAGSMAPGFRSNRTRADSPGPSRAAGSGPLTPNSAYGAAASTSSSTAFGGAGPKLRSYASPPDWRITLEEFEGLSFTRLKIMAELEDARARDLVRGKGLSAVLKDLVKDTHVALVSAQDSHDDCVSHWVLAMAFCGTEETRRRFVEFESALFEFRYGDMLPSELAAYVEGENLPFQRVSEEEKSSLSDALSSVFEADGNMPALFRQAVFYKMPFTHVNDLVAMRRVFVRRGLAYVLVSDLGHALRARFAADLTARLETASRSLPYVAARDDRVGPLLRKLREHKSGSSYTRSIVDGQVTLADVPALAQRSFPMCARHLERGLVGNHHLHNMGRLQYQLFLKGIGLSMDDCLAYFQREFMKRPMTSDEFRKQGYAYSIRHSYGKEGSRKDYAPWSCSKAIAETKGETKDGRRLVHGCPFKDFDENALSHALKTWGGLGPSEPDKLRRVVEKAKAGDFQIACRLHWELMHPGGNVEAVGNHPNAFFDQSVLYWRERSAAPSGAGAVADSAAAATTTTTTTMTTTTSSEPTTTPPA